MKNFKIRIYNQKIKKLIYPSESFVYTISLCGEVFRNLECSIKDKEGCKIMLFSGLYDNKNNEIYEGDVVYNTSTKTSSIIKFYGGFIYINIDGIDELNGCFLINDDIKSDNIFIIDNIFINPRYKKFIKLF